MKQYVLCEQNGPVATVTIDSPPVNALSRDVIDQLKDRFDELDQNAALRAVILTGNGKSFVAGADISEMPNWTVDEAERVTRKGQQLFLRIEQFRVPVIAAVNGYALGGGLELAMACDIRIVSEKAKLGLPETALGTVPGYGGTYRLQKLVPQGMANLMIYSADPVSAARALQIGLADEVVPPDALLPRAREVAETIASRGPIAVRLAKRAMRACSAATPEEGMEIEVAGVRACFASTDIQEGLAAFTDKRQPRFCNQ